ncbi:MAG: hypothetical protein KAJ29_04710 [Alphaproteobacteria bacterium]|nr:hypothetical protein [Alphaproteobacteria bacterium]
MSKKLSEEDKAQLRTKCQKEWDANPATRKEFLNFDNYYSYHKGVESGTIRIMSDG